MRKLVLSLLTVLSIGVIAGSAMAGPGCNGSHDGEDKVIIGS